MTIDEIMQKGSEATFKSADIEAVCSLYGLTTGQLFDAISARIVLGYISGKLSFHFCDGVMNRIFCFMIRKHHTIPPEYSYLVFLSFDRGEYYHPNDRQDLSPEDLYTKPMITAIVAAYGLGKLRVQR